MRSNLNRLMIAGLVTAGLTTATLAATVTTSSALPLATGNRVVSDAAPAVTTDVHWRGRGWRGGWGWHGGRRWHGGWGWRRGWGPGWGWGVGAAAVGLGVAAATAPYYYGGCWQDRWGRVWCR